MFHFTTELQYLFVTQWSTLERWVFRDCTTHRSQCKHSNSMPSTPVRLNSNLIQLCCVLVNSLCCMLMLYRAHFRFFLLKATSIAMSCRKPSNSRFVPDHISMFVIVKQKIGSTFVRSNYERMWLCKILGQLISMRQNRFILRHTTWQTGKLTLDHCDRYFLFYF